MDAKEVKKADRFIQLGIKAANEAMQDANFIEDFDKDRFWELFHQGILGNWEGFNQEPLGKRNLPYSIIVINQRKGP